MSSESSKSLPTIVFLLDASGSMQSLGNTPCTTFNEFINTQKKELGEFNATLILFNTDIQLVYKNLNSKDIKDLTTETYKPDYMTALYDAIGFGIETQKESSSNNVVFVVLTDGEENSSKKYKKTDIKKNIKEMESLGWKFIYLGANQDAFLVGNDMGISKTETFEYTQDGLSNVMRTLSAEVSASFITPTLDTNLLNSIYKPTPYKYLCGKRKRSDSITLDTTLNFPKPSLITNINGKPFEPKTYTSILYTNEAEAALMQKLNPNKTYTSPIEEESIYMATAKTFELVEISPSTFKTKKICNDWRCMLCKKNTVENFNMFEITVGKKTVFTCEYCINQEKIRNIFPTHENIKNNIENWIFINSLDDISSSSCGRSNKRKPTC
jgi:hypothetical protein